VTTPLRAKERLELIAHHAECELRRDWEGALATMTADPIYVHYPLGLRIRGREAVVEQWKRLVALPGFAEMVTSATVRNWVLDDLAVSMYEWLIDLGDGQSVAKNSYAVFRFVDGLIESETIYANSETDAVMRPAFGEDFLALPGVERLEEAELPGP